MYGQQTALKPTETTEGSPEQRPTAPQARPDAGDELWEQDLRRIAAGDG